MATGLATRCLTLLAATSGRLRGVVLLAWAATRLAPPSWASPVAASVLPGTSRPPVPDFPVILTMTVCVRSFPPSLIRRGVPVRAPLRALVFQGGLRGGGAIFIRNPPVPPLLGPRLLGPHRAVYGPLWRGRAQLRLLGRVRVGRPHQLGLQPSPWCNLTGR